MAKKKRANKKKTNRSKPSRGRANQGPVTGRITDLATGKVPSKKPMPSTIFPDASGTIDLPVAFGSVSIQKTTVRLPISIVRKVMGLVMCDFLFTDRQLTGKVVLCHSEDANGQKTLYDDMDHEVGGVFDVKGYRATSSEFKSSLTFPLKEIDVAELARLAAGSGRLVITKVAHIPEDSAAQQEEEYEADDFGDAEAESTARWRNESMKVIGCPPGLLQRLEQNHIETLGDMADFLSTGRAITSLGGLGPTTANRLLRLWREFGKTHPEIFQEVEAAPA